MNRNRLKAHLGRVTTMNIIWLYLAAVPVMFASYGLTWLLWTMAGIGIPGRRKRRSQRRANVSPARVSSRPAAMAQSVRAMPAHRIELSLYDAALPQDKRHGTGSHSFN